MAAHSIVNLSPSPTTSPTFLGNGGAPIPAAMFNPGHASSDDGGTDPKRRRIARACDMCRKKKVRMFSCPRLPHHRIMVANLKLLKLIVMFWNRSNVMVNYRRVHIVWTTKQNVSLPWLRRKEIPPKGWSSLEFLIRARPLTYDIVQNILKD